MPSSRARLTALLKPMLPEKWRGRIENYTVRNVGVLPAPAVFIEYTTISHEGMPQGQLLDEFEVALISNLTDYAKAEDELDSAIRVFVRALDVSNDVAWSTASKRAFGDQKYLGWAIVVQLLTPESEE